jgi:predicted TIM-barrel fold metal-dependent hydrolase
MRAPANEIQRRTFVAALSGLRAALAQSAEIPQGIIDTHTHFYDPARPQGVPWPAKGDTLLYRTVLPKHFETLTQPLGVTGTIVVEASPWLEDNQWILDLAKDYPFIVGFVGHLNPGTSEFRRDLSRFRRHRLFRGIRFGGAALAGDGQFLDDMKLLADADLAIDAGGGPATAPHLLRLTDRIPTLRIVINHLPGERPAEDPIDEYAQRPNVYAKVSGVLRHDGGRVPAELSFYRESLDRLWSVFGADRLVYGSNWPVSDLFGSYELVLKIVREYFAEKGAAASQKFFRTNSLAAYKWVAKG